MDDLRRLVRRRRNSFTGANRPDGADHSLLQKGRHIFGDLKIEIFDAGGQTGGHRGRQQASRRQPRDMVDARETAAVAPAASALGGAFIGPRVLPGTYTVKLTKGDQTYTEPQRTIDPRATYTLETARRNSSSMNRLAELLNHDLGSRGHRRRAR
jgi:hypothetical protein